MDMTGHMKSFVVQSVFYDRGGHGQDTAPEVHKTASGASSSPLLSPVQVLPSDHFRRP